MEITRTSAASGITRTLDLPVTPEQMAELERGALIQKALPNLTDAQREFILTGITDEEWDAMWPDIPGDQCEPDDDEPAF